MTKFIWDVKWPALGSIPIKYGTELRRQLEGSNPSHPDFLLARRSAVDQLTVNQCVDGSIPSVPANFESC